MGSAGTLTGAFAATTGAPVVAAPPEANNQAEPLSQEGAGVREAGPAILGGNTLTPGLASFTGVDPRDCAVAAECPEVGVFPDEPVWVVMGRGRAGVRDAGTGNSLDVLWTVRESRVMIGFSIRVTRGVVFVMIRVTGLVIFETVRVSDGIVLVTVRVIGAVVLVTVRVIGAVVLVTVRVIGAVVLVTVRVIGLVVLVTVRVTGVVTCESGFGTGLVVLVTGLVTCESGFGAGLVVLETVRVTAAGAFPSPSVRVSE